MWNFWIFRYYFEKFFCTFSWTIIFMSHMFLFSKNINLWKIEVVIILKCISYCRTFHIFNLKKKISFILYVNYNIQEILLKWSNTSLKHFLCLSKILIITIQQQHLLSTFKKNINYNSIYYECKNRTISNYFKENQQY